MTSTSSSFLSPFCTAKFRWKRNWSGRFIATNAATVARLRSRLDNSSRSQTSSKRTRSVRSANLGAISPIILCAAEGSFFMDLSLGLITFPGHFPVLIRVERCHHELISRKFIHTFQIMPDQRSDQCTFNVKSESVCVVDLISTEGSLVATLCVLHRSRLLLWRGIAIHHLNRHMPISRINQQSATVRFLNLRIRARFFERHQPPGANEGIFHL